MRKANVILLPIFWLLSLGVSWAQQHPLFLSDMAFVLGPGESRNYLREEMQAFHDQHGVRLSLIMLPEGAPYYETNARQDESLLLQHPSPCLSIITWHDSQNRYYHSHQIQVNQALAQRLPKATVEQIVDQWLPYYQNNLPADAMHMGMQLVLLRLGEYLQALPPPQLVPTVTFANPAPTTTSPASGLDAFTHEEHRSLYEVTAVNQADYPVAWKALPGGQSTSVLAQVAEGMSFPAGLVFKQNGNVVPAQPANRNHQQHLTLSGQMHEQEGSVEVYASADEEAELLGKLKTISYDMLYKKLVLVVLDNIIDDPPYLANLSRNVKAVFAQAGVSLSVESQKFDTGWGNRDVPLQDETSGMLSNYPPQLKQVIKDYRREHDEENGTAYIFLAGSSSTGKRGYMPKKRPYGFVYLDEHDGRESVAKTVAHELGHGLFRLKHSFERYPSLTKGSTANLMDYGRRGTQLHKYQWDYIHNPQAMLGWFQEEEENADMTFRQDVEWIIELYSPWYSDQFIKAFEAKNLAGMKKWIDKGLKTPFTQEQVRSLKAIDQLIPRKEDGSVPVAILKHYPDAKIKGLYVYYTEKDGAVVKAASRPRAFTDNLPVDITLHTGEFDKVATTVEDASVTEAFGNLAFDFVWQTTTEHGWTDQAVNWMKEAWAYPKVSRNGKEVNKIMTSIAETGIIENHTYELEEQIVYTYAFDTKTSQIPVALYTIEENPTFKRKDLVDLGTGDNKNFVLLGFCKNGDVKKPQLLIQVDRGQVQLVKDYFAPKGQLEQVQATFAKKTTLTATEIGEVRELIKLVEDKERKKELYRELQKKVPYHNQRDNINDDADYMCNLTSQAMCFEYLGIANPDPSVQFEDYLEKVRMENDLEEREYASARKAIASEFGVNQQVKLSPTMTRQYLENFLEPKINKGYGIVISVGGHLVRLEQVKDNGLIVDDPYGKVDLVKRYKNGNDSYGDEKNSSNGMTIKGENNLWKWEDIEQVKFKYIEWYYL